MAIFLFPVWAVLVSILAYLFPALLTQLKSWIIPLLVMVMWSMGLTLTWECISGVGLVGGGGSVGVGGRVDGVVGIGGVWGR